MTAVTATFSDPGAKVQAFDKNGKPQDPGYQGTGRTVCQDFTSTAPAGTSEEIVAKVTIPGGTLYRDGQILHFVIYGTHAANTNSAVLAARFGGIGGTVVATRTSVVSGDILRLEGYIVRTGAATQKAIGKGLSTDKVLNTASSPTQTLSGDVDLVVTCTNGTAASDLAYTGMFLEILG